MPDPRPPRLLILEDDDLLAEMIRLVATEAGFEGMVAGSAAELFGLVRQHPDAALMLDIIMPEVDGLEVLRELVRLGFRGPVQVLSGCEPLYLDTVTRLAERQGVNLRGAFQKPATPTQLQAMIEGLRTSLA